MKRSTARRWLFRARTGSRDNNHAAIAKGLRALGYLVVDLAGAGAGVPDLMVFSRSGRLVFVEVKVAKAKLRESQVAFAARLASYDVKHGVARSLDEALVLIGHDARSRAAVNGAAARARIAADVERLAQDDR